MASDKGQHQQLLWSIARMRNVVRWFEKLDRIDREYILRRFRDQDCPAEFRRIANEAGR